MNAAWTSISQWLSDGSTSAILRGIVVLGLGLVVARIAAVTTERTLGRRLTAHHAMIVRRIVGFGLATVAIAAAMREVGFDMSLLVGTAGILTVALGFASQTSASNLISGLFLMGEEPFVIGDVIRVGSTTGEVISIDPLSVRLRTFDNLMVRLPNESLLKSELTNLTRFPIRRLDLVLRIGLAHDVDHTREVLLTVAEANPACLEHPAPLLIYLALGSDGQEIQFSVWAAQERFLELRNTIQVELKRALDAAGIAIARPTRSLGIAVGEVLPVRVVNEAETTVDPHGDA